MSDFENVEETLDDEAVEEAEPVNAETTAEPEPVVYIDHIDDIIDAVMDLAEETEPYADLVRGPLPPDNGISIYMGASGPSTTFMHKRIVYDFNLTLNGKHASQQTVAKALNAIHTALTTAKSYPATDYWEIANIETIELPAYLDREENNQYLYGSSLRVRAYIFGQLTETQGDNNA